MYGRRAGSALHFGTAVAKLAIAPPSSQPATVRRIPAMRNRLLAAVFLVFLSSLPNSSRAIAADWPQWRGPNRDGAAPESPSLITALPENGLTPTWLSEPLPGGGAGGWGSPIVAGGKVYLFTHHKSLKPGATVPPRKFPYLADDKRGGMSPAEYEEYEKNRRAEDAEIAKLYAFQETVVALDIESGKTVWRSDVPSIYTRFVHSGTLAHHDGKLYILGAGLKARCVSAADGKQIWETQLPGDFADEFYSSSFLIADGAALVFAGKLFGLDAADGKLLWEGTDKMKGQHTSPVAWKNDGKELAIANVSGGDTIGFEPRTGKELWRVKSEANASTPVVIGDRMITYGGSRRSGMRCFKLAADKAEELWNYQRAGDKGSSPVVVGGAVYVQGEKRLACVDLETGDELWSTTLDLASPQYTSLVAADDKVIYAFDGLTCFAADKNEFRPLIEVKFNKAGLMATEDAQRKLLKLDEVERKPNGLEESTKIYQREIGNQGPLPCTSPAVVDGRLVIRLRDRVACYDFRAGATPQAGTSTPSSGE
jgi:outer membrane protein assembly factor BamB